jgi:ribosomal protein L25 (general stress protein Ctc)
MPNSKITVTKRDEAKNPRQLRAAGFVTGSIYGKGMDAVNIQLNAHEFELQYKNNKESNWEIDLEGKKLNTKIQELQINHATGEFLNVEFATI